MTLLSLVKLVHLIGLIMGFGGAIFVDLLILKGAILSPVLHKTMSAARTLSHVVFAGLALLWLSGIALVWIRVSADPHVWMNEKIWAKVTIVCILTINGIAVHNIALGHLANRHGRKLFTSSRPFEMAGLTLIAAVSSVSWFVPFVLGVATEFNFTVKAAVILSVYVGLILMAWSAFYALARLTCEKPRFHGPAHDGRFSSAVLARAESDEQSRSGVALQYRGRLNGFDRQSAAWEPVQVEYWEQSMSASQRAKAA